jgi:hypothetical protein
MKVGDLVMLRVSMWSSYSREGEIGMVLETPLRSSAAAAEETFSRVWWSKDSQAKLYRSDRLEVINESR